MNYIAILAVALHMTALPRPALAVPGQVITAESTTKDPSPFTRICANGYVSMFLITGNESYSEGNFPTALIDIDQTGFTNSGTVRLQVAYKGDTSGQLKWDGVIQSFRDAFLTRSPTLVYSSHSGTAYKCTGVLIPRDLTVQMCANESGCGGSAETAAESPATARGGTVGSTGGPTRRR